MTRGRCLSLLATLVASTAFSVVDDDGEGAWPAAGETLPPVAAKHKAAYDAALHRRQLIIGGNTAPQWQHTHQILLTSSENIAYIESAKVDEEGSGTEATAVNLRNRLMSLEGDLQEQSTRWK